MDEEVEPEVVQPSNIPSGYPNFRFAAKPGFAAGPRPLNPAAPPFRPFLQRRRNAAGDFIGGWEKVPQESGPPEAIPAPLPEMADEFEGVQENLHDIGGMEDEGEEMPSESMSDVEEPGIYEDWSEDYDSSAWWGDQWKATQDPQGAWPLKIRLYQNTQFEIIHCLSEK